LSFPHPGRAQFPGQGLVLGAAGEDVDLPAEVPRDLDGDVGRCAEAVEAEPPRFLAVDSAFQSPISHDPRAQKRRRFFVRESAGEWVDEIRYCHRVLGKTPVHVPAGEAGTLAKVLLATAAEAALPTRFVEPRHPHPLPH